METWLELLCFTYRNAMKILCCRLYGNMIVITVFTINKHNENTLGEVLFRFAVLKTLRKFIIFHSDCSTAHTYNSIHNALKGTHVWWSI